jgi:hypothetical protein
MLVTVLLTGLVSSGAPQQTLDVTPPGASIDGRYLKAFQIAFADLVALSELTERQRRIDGYILSFSEDRSHLYLLFLPKRTESERRTYGGRLLNGVEVKYTIDKKSYSIVRRVFFR